ncbi:MAG TPA: D-alanyl-D-alanine carboxypeptidase family protein [Opitutaceae bacterium]|nr:D-alanyl-D-alanine carboxypeptidase family protein [Opitutaceae bacterium]
MFAPKFRLLLAAVLSLAAGTAPSPAAAPRKPAPTPAGAIDPNAFRSAIVVDAATGRVLFEQNADVQNPPASVTKLMTFLIVSEKLKLGELALNTPVTVPREAAKMGGSEAWLVDREVVSVEELLYLLMVQSANDAAMALAMHTTGSREAFVELMNLRAHDLGMAHTEFHSPHGLPPSRGQEPDLSTARDLAILSRKLIAETDILRYTSTREHEFRHQNGVVNKFRNHNHLLGLVPGCDGLKTGWYQKAGYSLAATIQRGGRRIIAVILGSPERKLRDTVTTQLIERGFAALPPPAAPTQAVTATLPVATPATPAATAPSATAPNPPPPAGKDSSGIKLVPLKPDELKQPPAATTEPPEAVHVDIPGAKK